MPHILYIHSTPYTLPSRWDELTRRQLITIAWLTMAGTHSIAMAKLMFLVLTQSLPWWQQLRVRFFYFFLANVTERADMISLTRSFFENREFTTQQVKKIGGKSVLFGPSSSLANITLWEYIRAEQAFLQYLKTEGDEHLDKLVAILYRPARSGFNPDVHEDIRVPLVDASVPLRVRRIRSVSKRTKIAVLIWFDGCRSKMITIFPILFKKEDKPLNNKLQAGASPPSTSGNWLDLITSLSPDMTKFEAIGNTNLFVAFNHLSNRIKQNRKPHK